MLKTLVFAGLAAFAGKKLYESGALDEFVADAKARLNGEPAHVDRLAPQPAAPIK